MLHDKTCNDSIRYDTTFWQHFVRFRPKKRSDVKQKEEEARTARLEGRARIVEESRKSYEDRVRREEDEIAAREQDVSRGGGI